MMILILNSAGDVGARDTVRLNYSGENYEIRK
jgi:hypothetical protein